MKIQTDKLLHLFAGYIIAITIGLWSPLGGLITGVVVGLAKEVVWDRWLGKGTFELADWAWTSAGSLAAYLVLLIRIPLI